MSLYSDEVKVILRTPDWPKALKIEIVEYEAHLGFRLFRENFETFDGVDKQHIAGMVGKTILQIRSIGVPCYLEVVKGSGEHVRT